MTILIEAAVATLLLLGSALLFKEILELDASHPPAAKPVERKLRRHARSLDKAA